jgi:hypothetical protein
VVLEPAPGAHPVEQLAGTHPDALYRGALRAGWAAAVLAQPEGAPAAAASGSEAALVNMPTAHL